VLRAYAQVLRVHVGVSRIQGRVDEREDNGSQKPSIETR
jgi:hypothetical protein